MTHPLPARPPAGVRHEIVETPDLGDRSYIAWSGSTAVVVDPQRDTDRVHEVLERHGLAVALVLETHLHNDYVTGGLALARATGADYVVAAAEDVAFSRRGVTDGDELDVGDLRVQVLGAPGHTPHHVAYVVRSTAGAVRNTPFAVHGAGAPPLLFTGGSLLLGSVGRPDLSGPDLTVGLARAQRATAHRLVAALPPQTVVLPTHGFGSFCSAGPPTTRGSGTLAEEAASNPVLNETDPDAFVRDLLAGLAPHPAYYRFMGPANAAGPTASDLAVLAGAPPEEVARRVSAGEWVVDVRPRAEFAAAHVPGTLSVDVDGSFATYLGWVMAAPAPDGRSAWDRPVTLLGATDEQVDRARRALSRIRTATPEATAAGPASALGGPARTGSYPVVGWAEVNDQLLTPRGVADGQVLLDVRAGSERDAGHVPGSVGVPLGELPTRLDEVPAGRVWVHCASGFRACVGASLLSRAGRDVVVVDDSFDDAPAAGVPVLAAARERSRVPAV